MGSAKTKVRIFSIGLTSVLIMVILSTLLKMGMVTDYNTMQVMIFAIFTSGLVFIFSVYSGLVLLVEGLLLKWGNKVFEAQKEDDEYLP